MLQQHLPFTVLKLTSPPLFKRTEYKLQQHLPFTVLKRGRAWPRDRADIHVATALTVYGIETKTFFNTTNIGYTLSLQQHLPFTVLKRMFLCHL